jgi:hypothetical protein
MHTGTANSSISKPAIEGTSARANRSLKRPDLTQAQAIHPLATSAHAAMHTARTATKPNANAWYRFAEHQSSGVTSNVPYGFSICVQTPATTAISKRSQENFGTFAAQSLIRSVMASSSWFSQQFAIDDKVGDLVVVVYRGRIGLLRLPPLINRDRQVAALGGGVAGVVFGDDAQDVVASA